MALSIFNMLRREVAGTRLTESELIESIFEKKVHSLDLENQNPADLLEKVTKKLELNHKVSLRLSFAIWGSLLLAFAALKGVDLEVSLLGVKLSGVLSIKHWILAGATCLFVLQSYHTAQTLELNAIRKILYKRVYGRVSYDVFHRTFSPGSGESWASYSLGFGDLRPNGRSALVGWMDHILAILAMLIVLIMAIMVVATVAVSVWSDPNLGFFSSKLISLLSVPTILLSFALLLVRLLAKRWYIDEEKWRRFPFYSPGTEELSDEVKDYIARHSDRR